MDTTFRLKIDFLLQELVDVEGDGMADMVFRCIQEMDIDNRMMVRNSLKDKLLPCCHAIWITYYSLILLLSSFSAIPTYCFEWWEYHVSRTTESVML